MVMFRLYFPHTDEAYVQQKTKKVKTVYISNLNYKIDEEDLTGIFGKYGRVDDVMVMMKPGGKLRMGMAFVRMRTHESALKAIEGLNGKVIDGRTVKAIIAREDQAPRPKHITKDQGHPSKESRRERPAKAAKKNLKKNRFKEFLKSRK